MRRKLAIALVSGISVVGGLAAGWMLAIAFQSPAQVEALSAPPPASTVTAAVEFGNLSRSISVRARAAFSTETALSVTSDAALVVTKTGPPVGASVDAGDIASEVNGAPVFVLPGEFPFYRDLALGDEGPDVLAFQKGLVAAGFQLEPDGNFGGRTEAGLVWLYERGGYKPPRIEVEVVPPAKAKGSDTEVSPGELEPMSPGAADAVDTRPRDQTAPSSGVDAPVQRSTPVLRIGAIVVAPQLPAVVSATPAVGKPPEGGAILTLASGELRLVTPVTPETAAQLSVGMGGEATDASGANPVTVRVDHVGAELHEDGTVDVLLAVEGGIESSRLGEELIANLEVEAGVADGLIVPTRAVTVRGESSLVRKVSADGSVQEVSVREVESSLGRSIVEAVSSSSLAAGDEVVVE